MEENRLQMYAGKEPFSPSDRRLSERVQRDNSARARFERMWNQQAHLFDPDSNPLERLRIRRSLQMLSPLLSHSPLQVADLGIGWGALTEQLLRENHRVDGVDIAAQAVQRLDGHSPLLTLYQRALPNSELPADHYDLVMALDIIAELHPNDQRLLLSDIVRILKKEGKLLISTPLDIDSLDPLDHFIRLLETEFSVEETMVSYHGFYLRLQKRALTRWLAPEASINGWEAFCRFFAPDSGVSHVILVAKTKPLAEPEHLDMRRVAKSRQELKRRVWE